MPKNRTELAAIWPPTSDVARETDHRSQSSLRATKDGLRAVLLNPPFSGSGNHERIPASAPAEPAPLDNVHFSVHGLDYTATFSRFVDGRLGELFLSNHKTGSAADTSCRDAAITFSIAIQCGADPEIIRRALCGDAQGRWRARSTSSPAGVRRDDEARHVAAEGRAAGENAGLRLRRRGHQRRAHPAAIAGRGQSRFPHPGRPAGETGARPEREADALQRRLRRRPCRRSQKRTAGGRIGRRRRQRVNGYTWRQIARHCASHEHYFNDWEREFIRSVAAQLASRSSTPSPKQAAVLKRIFISRFGGRL